MADPTQCPVCNMQVDPQTAPNAHHQEEDYYFCSDSCHELFLLDPSRYVGV
ncbi:MAG TPA: YHS domain-containing protein [Arachnia sp.]|nr:YHS domain-containing protein [Arachnia sp.]HMT87446.1 YHS domain-containing protein [Arachnia sp.]